MTAVIELPGETTHLRRLSGMSNNLILEPTKGKRTFVTERAMFPRFFSEDFVRYGTDVASEPTGKIIPVVYEQMADGSFSDILVGEIGQFWQSQDPLLSFVKKYPNWLHPEGWPTFFPFLVGKKRFVAHIRRGRGKLSARVDHFEDSYVWYGRDRFRFVLPQLVTK